MRGGGQDRVQTADNRGKDEQMSQAPETVDGAGAEGTVETRGDERVELLRADTNNDGRTDVWVVDTDGDGKADLFQFDTDGDGKVDVTMVDIDEDGQPDEVVDGDGGLPPEQLPPTIQV
ncbi:hypothetical protein Van01_17330 [Micromonospora andamanensis]|uniref:EF-hand domain-containing protein n=2 Tax=Micromonosporaceae TaxID=28056 RepID=A0ABQ4HS78_9ACTN|nr:hypothetical protein Van01_17330 [Micromonospora andamanensis]GIJ39402.1 hypothetical protein Vwe01_27270 [Micromonospora andamanensis]